MVEYCEERVKRDPTLALRNDFLLVHGIIKPPDGHTHGPIAHAWVEEGLFEVTFSGILNGEKIYATVDKDEYYKASGVTECTKYTMKQLLAENRASGNYGPWKESYQQLCRT
jgi:hypothetical protein